MRFGMLVAVGLGLGAGGCAPSAQELEVRLLAKNVRELQAQVARYDHRFGDLSSELLLLRDKLDRAQDAREIRQVVDQPTLEVVRLVPGEGERAPDEKSSDRPREPEESPIEITLHGEAGPPPLPVRKVPPPPKMVATKKPVAAKNPVAEALFQSGLEAYRGGATGKAHGIFERVVREHPTYGRADNAVYWMAECRFDQSRPADAVAELRRLIKDYPQSEKVFDAWFKIGIALERLSDFRGAKAAFKRVVDARPESAVAELARTRLQAPDRGGRR